MHHQLADAALVESWPPELVVVGSSLGSIPLVGPVRVPCVSGRSYLLAMRLTLEYGALEIHVGNTVRRITRLGPYLAIVPYLSRQSGVEVMLWHPERTGPIRFIFHSLRIQEVEPDTVAAAAVRLEAEFEEETGRMADPVSDNLVPNADFEEDDEVRGLPAHWSAYTDVEIDQDEHVLSVNGTPYEGRPALATGPAALVPGRRYRAECRVRVVEGELSFRAMDYDELNVLASASLDGGDRDFEAYTLEFVAPGDAKAVRLWIAPERKDSGVRFDLRAIQLELLPEANR